MKKFTLSLFVMASAVAANAQLPVSHTPGNKQALVEEFTGHTCQFCPDGHKKVDQLIQDNPGSVFGVNIHAGGYANTSASYPNDFKTDDGVSILALPGMELAGYPAGIVNRLPAASPQKPGTGGMAMSRGSFAAAAAAVTGEASYVNIAGEATVDNTTRKMTVKIEAYYTADGPASNKLSVMLVQDKIMGPQSGGTTWYPEMMMNGTYTHNKVLRDVLTTGATGEAMAGGTTSGTTFKKTIEFDAPLKIKNLNLVFEDCWLLAFVSASDKEVIAVTKFPLKVVYKTGVETPSGAIGNMVVYPNPAANYSLVDFSLNESRNVSVEVTNMLGQTVFTKDMGQLNAGEHNLPLDFTNIQNGMYMVKISDGNSSVVKNISVQK